MTVRNFTRAETDLYFRWTVAEKGIGKLTGPHGIIPIDQQTVVRMNRDTPYASGAFDLDAAPVTLPDPGKRFMLTQVISQDHDTIEANR